MSSFEVVIIGVGDAFSESIDRARCSSPAAASTSRSTALTCTGPRCGRRASTPVERSPSQTSTHVHGDHMNGLEGVAFYKHFAAGKKVQLVTSPEVRAVIWDERLKASMSALWDGQQFGHMCFDDSFDHVPLDWTEDIQIGPFRIRARRTIHHVRTSALLVEADGRTLGYSTDTVFDPELISFLAPADLIIHETNLGPAHTPYSALSSLPAELRSWMRLIHYPDAFDTTASTIAALREGEVLRP